MIETVSTAMSLLLVISSANFAYSQQTTFAVQDGSWNNPAIWSNGVPTSNTRAIITGGTTVFLDGSDHFAKEIVVQGNLSALESAGTNKSLTADWIHVNSGGVFQIGTATDRYDANDIVVTLTGDDPSAVFDIEGVPNAVTDNNGFLMAASGGRLQFFGKNKTSFTKLALTAEVGSNFIVVESRIDRNFDGLLDAQDSLIDWSIGDEIVISSSSRDYLEEEVRRIVGVNDVGDGTQVVLLDLPLVYRHYGEIETYQNSERQYQIDMRAEVAVLSRNIKIQGEPEHDTDNFFGDRARFNAGTGDGFGGHLMIMESAGQISLDNVQFNGMGQTSRLGRYPVHWHVGGDRRGDFIRGASITNSNNRGVTIHATHNVLVQDVVLHDVHGHGFFMENGVETGNLFLSNLALGIHQVGRLGSNPNLNDPFIVDTHDHVEQNAERFLSSAGFWMTNPDNVWVGNISAGSEGTGYWFIFPTFAIGDSADDPQYLDANANETNLRQFDHNSSHSSPIGFNMDRGPDIEVPVGAMLDLPSFGRRYLPPNEPQFNHYTAYQHDVGVYQRGDIANFYENRFADNFTSTFITFTQRITNTLYVGHSHGNANPSEIVTGHSLYDGANTLVGNHFAGFHADNAHTFRTHGEETRHTAYACSNTSFENDGTINNISISTRSGGANHSDAFSPSVLLDVDGSLTGAVGGVAGTTIVTNRPFLYDSGDLQPAGWNAWLSDDLYSLFHVRGLGDGASFRFTAPDGDSATIEDNSFNTILKNDVGDYVIEFPNGIQSVESGFEILHYTRVGPSGATVVRFEGIGQTLSPDMLASPNLNTLRNSSSSTFFRDGENLWVKFFSSSQRIDFAPFEGENTAPTAIDDVANTTSNQSVLIDVLQNDFDPDGDALAVVPFGESVTTFLDDFQSPEQPENWQYLWNATSEFGDSSGYEELVWDTWRYRPTSIVVPYFSVSDVHPGLGTDQDPSGVERFAIAAFTVPMDGSYAINDSLVSVNPGSIDGINIRAHVTGGDTFSLEDLFVDQGDFDGSLGFLEAGQVIYVGVGANANAGGDATGWNFSIVKSESTANGSLVFNSNGTVEYLPNEGFVGNDTFGYEITDGRGGRDTAVVNVDVESGDISVEQFHVNIGNLTAGRLPDLLSSDDSYIRIFSEPARLFFENSIQMELTGTSQNLSPDSLRFSFESRTSTVNVFQKIDIFNNETGLFQTINSDAAPTTDQIVNVLLTEEVHRFVNQDDGEIRVRVSWAVVGPVFGFPWSLYVDHASWQ